MSKIYDGAANSALAAIPSPPRSSNTTSGAPPVTAPRNTLETKSKTQVVTPENEPAHTDKKGPNESNKSSPMYPPLRPPRGKPLRVGIPVEFRPFVCKSH